MRRCRPPRNGRKRTACRSRMICSRVSDQPAVAGHDHLRAQQSVGRRPEDHRGDLYAAVSGARLDRTVLRGRAIRRRRDDGVDAHARRLSRPPAAIAEMLRVPPASVRLIHVEGSGCYGHNGADDAAADAALIARALPGRPGARAMDARAGACLGAVRPGDGDEAEGVARRRRQDRRLEFRGLEQHPFDAAGRRRLDAGGAAHGAALRRAGAKAAAAAGRRRRSQCDPDLHISQRACGASLHPGDADADFGDARARRLSQRVLDREFHGRTRRSRRRRSRRIPAEASRRSARPRRDREGGARALAGRRGRRRRRTAATALPLRATRISRPIAPSPARSRSIARPAARGWCARWRRSTAGRWSIRTG